MSFEYVLAIVFLQIVNTLLSVKTLQLEKRLAKIEQGLSLLLKKIFELKIEEDEKS